MFESKETKIKGIVYMSVSMGWLKKPPEAIREDLRRMRAELYANAIRLEGHDQLTWQIAEMAQEEGLRVWLHPKADCGVPPRSVFCKLEEEFAEQAGRLGIDVYLIGNELSLEVNLWDERTLEYTKRDMPSEVIAPLDNNPGIFQTFLSGLVEIARERFSGPIGYVAGSWEFNYIDWEQFDLVVCNQFFWPPTQNIYLELLAEMKSFGKPAILGECAYMTIDRAFEAGPLYWYPEKHQVRYDEEAQAACIREALEQVRAADLDGVFIHEWQALHNEGFGLVRSDGKAKRAYRVVTEFFQSWGR